MSCLSRIKRSLFVNPKMDFIYSDFILLVIIAIQCLVEFMIKFKKSDIKGLMTIIIN